MMEMSDSEEDGPVPYGDEIKKNFNKNEEEEKEDDMWIDEDDPLAEFMPVHCGGNLVIRHDPSKRRREPEPTRVIEPDECFVSCPRIIKREEWGAKLPKKQPEQMMFRVRPAVFKQSECYNCSDRVNCTTNMQMLQMYQMDYLGFTDIAYSFMIGEDGNVYEGRGWGNECEKARGFMGIGFMGYYTDEGLTRPSDEMLQLAYNLILCGIRKGFIANPFKLWGDRQTPVEMMRDFIENEEDVDYRTKIEDPGIY